MCHLLHLADRLPWGKMSALQLVKIMGLNSVSPGKLNEKCCVFVDDVEVNTNILLGLGNCCLLFHCSCNKVEP